jgi:hypothetical protein
VDCIVFLGMVGFRHLLEYRSFGILRLVDLVLVQESEWARGQGWGW